MPKPTIREHNQQINEIIDREMTDAEFAEFKEFDAKMKAERKAVEDKEKTKALLLERLGITAEEAALLLG